MALSYHQTTLAAVFSYLNGFPPWIITGGTSSTSGCGPDSLLSLFDTVTIRKYQHYRLLEAVEYIPNLYMKAWCSNGHQGCSPSTKDYRMKTFQNFIPLLVTNSLSLALQILLELLSIDVK
jgi:hypothetical protein